MRAVVNRLALILLLATAPCCTAAPSSGAHPHGARDVFLIAGGDLLDAPASLWGDAKTTFSDGSNLMILGGALGLGLIQEATLDEKEDRFFAEHTLYSSTMSDLIAVFGSGFALFGANALWSLGALSAGEMDSYHDSKLMMRSLGLTSLATVLLKSSVDDHRPNGGAYDFPSGHASLSMAAASTLDELYGPMAGIPAYGISVLVGLQRMDTQHHDSESVLFGFALGWVIGHSVSGQKMSVLGMDVEAVADPVTGDFGLALVRHF